MCKVIIRLAANATGSTLNLREVQLYGSDGTQVPPGVINMTLSSMAAWWATASTCNDGVTWNCCCATAPPSVDPKPSLVIAYPCEYASPSLSAVTVYNGMYIGGDVSAYINSFEMVFLNATGMMDAFTYSFTGVWVVLHQAVSLLTHVHAALRLRIQDGYSYPTYGWRIDGVALG